MKAYQVVVVGHSSGALKSREFDESIFTGDEEVLGRHGSVDDVPLRLEVRQGANCLDTDVEQRLDVVRRYGTVSQTLTQSAAVVVFGYQVERTVAAADAKQPVNVLMSQTNHRTHLVTNQSST